MIDLSQMTTEQQNEKSQNLDEMSALEMVTLMNQEDEQVISAVRRILPQIAKTIEATTDCLKHGGRLIYLGAGTSGRLGVLDAVECPPTFGTNPELVVGLIAGGDSAFVTAIEGAEDSQTLAEEELRKLSVNEKDIVIGLAASGRTPYVIHGLRYARGIGCKTGAIVCNEGSQVAKEAELVMEVIVGPEVLTGSTRLKAGTAQKMILNMISTCSMVGIGKVYQNYMVDLKRSNEKLITRSENIVMVTTGCDRSEAKLALDEADGSVKLAITQILSGLPTEAAAAFLEKAEGKIRLALQFAEKETKVQKI